MINFSNFYQLIAKNNLSLWLETLPSQIAAYQRKQFGQYRKWNNVIKFLPEITPHKLDLQNSIIAESESVFNKGQKMRLEKLLRNLMPWRKGPFSLYGLNINAEWRSDWKWNRILPYCSDLTNKTILDVGAGNGYYLWRMLGAGANLVIGIDPLQLSLYQFEAIRKLLGNNQRVHLLPISIEQLPDLAAFDIVFSMGVLYHCRSPLEHIWQLKNQLVSGGELIIETLIIEGDEKSVLVPRERYAKMRNVYFIPSALTLKNWLERCGFVNICIANTSITSIQEQRRTGWMINESLEQSLNPLDYSKTIEGYPAPRRAVLIATKPLTFPHKKEQS